MSTCKMETVEFYCNEKSKLKLFVILSLATVSQLIANNNWFSSCYTNSYKVIKLSDVLRDGTKLSVLQTNLQFHRVNVLLFRYL